MNTLEKISHASTFDPSRAPTSIERLCQGLHRNSPRVGKIVRVTEGLVHYNKTGVVINHGVDPFQSTVHWNETLEQKALREARGARGYFVEIQPNSGSPFRVSADSVEVLS